MMKKSLQILIVLALVIVKLSANAQDNLWVTTSIGGSNNCGTLIKGDTSGNNFSTDFNFIWATGRTPWGKIAYANNGKLYGVTNHGGAGDSCIIFKFDPITNIYDTIH